MSYTPENVNVFTSAYAGALAGMAASGRHPTDDTAALYNNMTDVAGAFAESFDTNWNTGAVTSLDLQTIQSVCHAAWQDRTPLNEAATLLPATYDDLTAALIAIVNEGRAYFTAEGITPPSTPSTTSLSQVNWYFNATTGDDTNSGATSAEALATFAEFRRRLGVFNLISNVSNALNLFVETDMPATDPLNLYAVAGPDMTFTITGTASLAAATYSAVTAINQATNQAWEITDATATFAVGDLLAFIPVADIVIAAVTADLGAGVYRLSNAVAIDIPGRAVTPTALAAAPSTYYVVTLPEITLGAFQVNGTSSTGDGYAVIFDSISFANGVMTLPPSTMNYVFSACKFNAYTVFSGVTSTFLSCVFAGAAPVYMYNSDLSFLAGYASALFDILGGRISLIADFMFQGEHVEAAGGSQLNIYQACIFDSTEDHGLHIHADCVVNIQTNEYGTGSLWGDCGAGAVAVAIGAGAQMRCGTGVTPTITGGLGEFTVAGNATARAFDEATGAFTTARACTWALFDATIAGGGFARNAHDVPTGASLIEIE